MEAKRIDSYIKHGCNFHGKLVVVDYTDEWKSDPRREQWGSMSIFDHSEKATALVKKRYPNCKILLSVPDVVARLEEETPADDYDWQDDTDDRGWLTYGERMASQSRAEM